MKVTVLHADDKGGRFIVIINCRPEDPETLISARTRTRAGCLEYVIVPKLFIISVLQSKLFPPYQYLTFPYFSSIRKQKKV